MSSAKRYGSVAGIEKAGIEEYKKLHAATWPDVLKIIEDCNIRNYSIYLGELEKDKYYLFSYFEYVGDDFEGDMAKMAADETTQKWWAVCIPCLRALECGVEGEWWMNMEEVFHTD